MSVVVSFICPEVSSADGGWSDRQTWTFQLGGEVSQYQAFSALELSVCRRRLYLSRVGTRLELLVIELPDVCVNAGDVIPCVLSVRGVVLPWVIGCDFDDRGSRAVVEARRVVGRWNGDSGLGHRVGRVDILDKLSGGSRILSLFPGEDGLGSGSRIRLCLGYLIPHVLGGLRIGLGRAEEILVLVKGISRGGEVCCLWL